jgi:hypothetical protein
MISARSRGLPAVGVAGDHAWEAEWAGLLAGRHVSVIMDCDRAGRRLQSGSLAILTRPARERV